MKITLIFIDGLGIGLNDANINPCAGVDTDFFHHFIDNSFPGKIPLDGIAIPLDPTLGVAGLPQSATGQTALLTGVNAAKVLGYHLQGFPNEALRTIIYRESILKKITESGRTAAFMNVYPPIYFEYGPEVLHRKLSVTSHATLASNFKFFNFDDLIHHRAIYQEFTNAALISKGHDLPLFTPELAGEILARAVPAYDFSLYEYFQTDHAGHSMDMERARSEILKLERFLFSFLQNLDLSQHFVILTSDHGNIEDMTVKTHTSNSVMTLLWGEPKTLVAYQLQSITDITPLILRLLKVQ
ncbi:peptidase [candidate division KSB1 bacterium]|nr:peptidase [candidate division KSB1 bacterium]